MQKTYVSFFTYLYLQKIHTHTYIYIYILICVCVACLVAYVAMNYTMILVYLPVCFDWAQWWKFDHGPCRGMATCPGRQRWRWWGRAWQETTTSKRQKKWHLSRAVLVVVVRWWNGLVGRCTGNHDLFPWTMGSCWAGFPFSQRLELL